MTVCPTILPETQSCPYPARGPARWPTGPGVALGSSQPDAGAGETEDRAHLSASTHTNTPTRAQPGEEGKTPGQMVLDGSSSPSGPRCGALRPLLPADSVQFHR